MSFCDCTTTGSCCLVDKTNKVETVLNCFLLCVSGGIQWQAVWNICARGGHCTSALYQVWECLHRNVLGLHQRPPGQHRNQSHQSHRRRGTQVQGAHREEARTQVSTGCLGWCCPVEVLRARAEREEHHFWHILDACIGINNGSPSFL